MLAEQKATVGLNTGAKGIGKSVVPDENRTPTLADAGIDKDLAKAARKYAAVAVDTRPAKSGIAVAKASRKKAEKRGGLLWPLKSRQKSRKQAAAPS
jgi:hypothetical protein